MNVYLQNNNSSYGKNLIALLLFESDLFRILRASNNCIIYKDNALLIRFGVNFNQLYFIKKYMMALDVIENKD